MSTQTRIVPNPEQLTSLACTQCGSAEVRRLSLIYQEGLAIINTRSQGSGVAFGSGGGAAFGSTSTHTTGTQQTALSKRAAPPAKKHTILWAIAAAFVGFLTIGGLAKFSFMTLVFGGLTYLAVTQMLKAKAYNAAVFPTQYAQWERSFMCNRCGATFAS